MADSMTAPPASDETSARPQGPLAVDGACQQAFWRGRRLDLSSTESALLACLHQRAGETVTYEALLRAGRGTPLDQGAPCGRYAAPSSA